MGLLDKVKSAAQSAVGQAEELIKKQKAALDAHNAKQQQAAEDYAYLSKLKPCGRGAKGGAIPELPVERAVVCCGLDENNTFVVYYDEYAAPTNYRLHPLISFTKNDFAACVVDKVEIEKSSISKRIAYKFCYTIQLKSGETFTMYNEASNQLDDELGDMNKMFRDMKVLLAILDFFGPFMRAGGDAAGVNDYFIGLGAKPVFTEDGRFDQHAFDITRNALIKVYEELLG